MVVIADQSYFGSDARDQTEHLQRFWCATKFALDVRHPFILRRRLESAIYLQYSALFEYTLSGTASGVCSVLYWYCISDTRRYFLYVSLFSHLLGPNFCQGPDSPIRFYP